MAPGKQDGRHADELRAIRSVDMSIANAAPGQEAGRWRIATEYRYGDSNPGFWHEKPAS